MAKLPKPRDKYQDVVVFTAEEIRAMLAEAKRLQAPLRDTALMMLRLDMGARVGKACGLELRHVNWQESFLAVDGKTELRQLPFSRKIKAALKAYIDWERRAAPRGVRHLFLRRDGELLLQNRTIKLGRPRTIGQERRAFSSTHHVSRSNAN